MTTDTSTEPQAPATGTEPTNDGFDVDAWKAFATDVDMDPADARRRLEHSRTWERRAKDNADAAQKLPELEQATQELTTRAETAEGRVAELEPENLRLRVALERGLPADLIDRLKGDTEEELKADADKLLNLVAPTEPRPRVPAPDPSQGGDGGVPALNSDQLLETVQKKLGIG